jgi:preprotein translocase subunit SecA
MPSPSEIQRAVHEARRPPEPGGLDALAWRWVGRWRRAPWQLGPPRRETAAIEALRPEIAGWGDGRLDEELRAARLERARRPGDPAAGRARGLALLAEAAHRELRLRPYPVQVLAAVALTNGCFAEIDTGEGKTLSLAIAAAWSAWSGLPVHVITSNDYLAARDAGFLRPFYRRAGLGVAAVTGADEPAARFKAYRSAVAYTTAKEVAADYLRDLLRGDTVPVAGPRHHLRRRLAARDEAPRLQTGLHFAFVDEADNGLIDEAVTPLIISQPEDDDTLGLACEAVWRFAAELRPGIDYHADRALRVVTPDPGLADGLDRLDAFPVDPLWQSPRRRWALLRTALEAREFFLRDQHYVVSDGKVVIVDEATGGRWPSAPGNRACTR